jgi:hypothetical protein
MSAVVRESTRVNTNRFDVYMAATCTIIAFGGFAPTYWFQLMSGTFVGAPLLHLHGVVFSVWPVLLLVQAVLIARGCPNAHRALGLVGISLATAMVTIGVAAAIQTLNIGLSAGYGDRSRAFLVLPMSALGLFAGFVVAAIVNVRSPEVHKRLMLLATISLLQAATGRVFFELITGGGPGLRPGLGAPPPVTTAVVPSLLLNLLIVAGVVHDRRTRGRPHTTWLVGGAIITTVVLIRALVAATATWSAFADALARIAG